MHLKLNLNVTSVQYNLRCGTLDLLFLTFSPAVYANLSTTAFVPPVNPGPEPRILTGLTGAVISDLRYRDTESTKIFTEYEAHGQSPSSASIGVNRQTVCPNSTSQIHQLREDDYLSAPRQSLLYIRQHFCRCTPRQLQETPCYLRHQSAVQKPDRSGQKCG